MGETESSKLRKASGEKSEGMYYTPEHIVDIATGTGGFLKSAYDGLVNPPYSAQHRVQRIGFKIKREGKR